MHWATFHEFDRSRSGQPKGKLAQINYMTYLMLSHIGVLTKPAMSRRRLERQYAGMRYAEKATKVQVDFMTMRPDLIKGAQISSIKVNAHQFGLSVVKLKHRLDSRFLNKAFIHERGMYADVEATCCVVIRCQLTAMSLMVCFCRRLYIGLPCPHFFKWVWCVIS